MTILASTNKQHDAAGWLALAAAPSLAAMALISASAPSPLLLCAATAAMMPIDAMTAMYGLMSLFHLAPWLKIARRP